jgi:hypothetical protein
MDNPVTLLEGLQAKGEVLAESKWANYVDGLNGTDAPFTAIMLENTAKWLASMDETSRSTNVGNFDRFAFPLIRAVFPNLVAQDLVSVQPMDGPVGLVFFFDLIYGSDKGSITAGTPMFSSLTGHPGDRNYSSDKIDDEALGTGTGAVANFTGTLAYTPVRPGSVVLTDGTQIVRDDGAGNLIGDINPAGNNTLVYATGVYDVTFAANVVNGTAVTVDYEYDNEANSQVPEVDFQLTSAPVVAKINKLRTRYSLEAAQNLKALHGLSAETELVVALAQELRFEIDRTVINDVNSFAQATAVTWPLAPGAGLSYTEHKLSFVDVLIRGSNNIFQLTRRGQPNFMVMGLEVSSVVESLPGFKASDAMQSPNGVIYAGELAGRWRCYKDPYNIDGTATQRNFLIGYKGATFLDAGYVYAPYIPFYTTPTVVLDDFIARKGMATQWGKRKINGRFYCRGTVTGTFAP